MIRRYLTPAPWPNLTLAPTTRPDLRTLIEAAEARHSRRTGGGS